MTFYPIIHKPFLKWIVLFVVALSVVFSMTTLSVLAATKTTSKNSYMLTTKKIVYKPNDGYIYTIPGKQRYLVKTTSVYNSKTKKTKVTKRQLYAMKKWIPVTSSQVKAMKTRNPVAFEKEVLRLVNVERKKAKLSAVKLDKTATYTAYFKSKEMVTLKYFAHEGGSYGNWKILLLNFEGENLRYYGENIAYGQTTPKQVMRDWVNSPGHKANILRKQYTHLGVGVYTDKSNNRMYWTQHFLTR